MSLTPSVPLSPSRPKSVFCLPAGFSGCAFWRYRLPFGKLKKLGSELAIEVADNAGKQVNMQDIQRHVQEADLISMQAPGYKDALTLMKFYKSEKKKVIVDYDDFSFDLSPGNPRYAELGTKEAELIGEDGKPVFRWKDGENGFDLKANIAKYDAFKSCLENADLITTTTEYLAGKFRRYNPNVAICPNSVDFDLWRPIPGPERLKDEIRIGWFGGDSHFVDLGVFKNLLPRLCEKYKNVKIVFQAPPLPEWREFFKDIPQDRLEWYGWADLRYYTLMLADRHWDIGLCPLADNDFNRCKSNIKALEFSALGAAVVAQNIPPYSVEMQHGKTGFLAGSENEWFESVSNLIEDAELRNNIAMNGYLDAKERFNLDKNCRIWEQVYSDVIEGNHVGKSRDYSLSGCS